MRALVALLALLPLVFAARVYTPFDLRALARQASDNGVPRVPPQFNINSGGPEVGRFVAEDFAWILGETETFVKDDAIIGGAEKKNLPMYKSQRFGKDGATWGYNIPVMEPGVYGCTAHFAELDSSSFMDGKRIFDLHFATADEDDLRTFENIDVIDELDGAEFTVLTKTAENLVITGILSIRLKAVVGNAMLSGLTCERTGDLPPGVEPDFETDPRVPTAAVLETHDDDSTPDGMPVTGTEININCGGEAIGRFSAEDFSWIKGETSQWEGPPGVEIGGAEDKNRPAVKSHRYGVDGARWGYVIPLENPGVYDCSLHFSETDSQSFKIGARVFDIMIMDRKLKNVDIYRDAGEAPFTAVVKTFTDLEIPSTLMMGFKPTVGNAFVSAITCEKTGSLDFPTGSPDITTETPDGEGPEEPSPGIDPSLTPSPLSPSETPVPTDESSLPESPRVEPTPMVVASATPGVEETPVIPGGSEPSDSPTASDPETTEEEQLTSGPGLDAGTEASLDPELELLEGTFLQEYDLRAVVTDGIFTETIKDALIAVSTDAVTVPSTFAMIGIRPENIGIGISISRRMLKISSRQEGSSLSYLLTLQARHEVNEPVDTTSQYRGFVDNGEVNTRLRERGVENVEIEFVNTRAIPAQSEEMSSTNTSLIVGVTVGCILGVLIVVALVAFFVVNKKRNNEPNAAAFDAPPPAMTESEMSSVNMERSETGASVEYLDDDSTFTAATSRAGDHVDQVGFVKDVFGRGTADGAHGAS